LVKFSLERVSIATQVKVKDTGFQLVHDLVDIAHDAVIIEGEDTIAKSTDTVQPSTAVPAAEPSQPRPVADLGAHPLGDQAKPQARATGKSNRR